MQINLADNCEQSSYFEFKEEVTFKFYPPQKRTITFLYTKKFFIEFPPIVFVFKKSIQNVNGKKMVRQRVYPYFLINGSVIGMIAFLPNIHRNGLCLDNMNHPTMDVVDYFWLSSFMNNIPMVEDSVKICLDRFEMMANTQYSDWDEDSAIQYDLNEYYEIKLQYYAYEEYMKYYLGMKNE